MGGKNPFTKYVNELIMQMSDESFEIYFKVNFAVSLFSITGQLIITRRLRLKPLFHIHEKQYIPNRGTDLSHIDLERSKGN